MEKVSVVMCTYNGERFLAEQLDSILAQTYPLHEIVIQDDCSSDSTVEIIERYAARHPIIKFFRNPRRLGFNKNFFNAFSKATGDFIAVSDQDDIWDKDKISHQVNAIGSNLLNSARSKSFGKGHRPGHYDPRELNNNLLHYLYYSLPGHCMLFRRELLALLPDGHEDIGINYDSQLLMAASARDSVNIVNEVLVMHRRHRLAATYIKHDRRRLRSTRNGMAILGWSLAHYFKMQKPLREIFSKRHNFLEGLNVDGPLMRDALKLTGYEGRGLRTLLPMMRLHLKYRHVLFFTYSKGLVNFGRALLFCIMHIYYYRHHLPR